MICLANSISVAPPPGTRRLSCGKTTPKHNVLLKVSTTSYFFRIFLVYQECNRTLFHTDLFRIHFRTSIHFKGNLPEFTHSLQRLSRKTASFVKTKIIMQWGLVSQIFWLFKKIFNSWLTVTAFLDFLIFSIISVGNIIQETNLLYTKFNISTGITRCWHFLFCFLAF